MAWLGQVKGGPVDARTLARAVGRLLPVIVALNAGIALFLWVLTGWDLVSTLVHAQAIGLSIFLLQVLGHDLLLRNTRPWLVTVVAVPFGAAIGTVVGAVYDGHAPLAYFHDEGRVVLASLATSAVFGLAISAYFDGRGRLAEERARLRQEQLQREAGARALVEAELKLLQAQIEPHFLFNTLSNVVQLVEEDPPRARRMLLNLTSYLRGSLRRTRSGAATLGEELDLVRAYLEIQAVRMGERLAWTIRCAEALRDRPLAPLLLQPLVENALRHGLEPRAEGGRVTVSAEREGDALVLEVRDDGPGIDLHRPAGVGLANVRERVRAISGGAGSLTLQQGVPSGLCARITLPWLAVQSAASAPPAAPGNNASCGSPGEPA